MASPPRAVLRPVFATATAAFFVAGFAGVCAAQGTGDAAAPQGGYRGPFLSWTGKTPPAAAAPAPEQTPSEAAPVDVGVTYVVRRRAAPAVEAAPVSYMAPPRPPAVESAPPPAAESAPAPYVAPPAPAHETQRAPLAPAAPAHAAAAAAPVQTADAAAPAGSPKTHVHFYSLHRAYGMTPDPIAMPVKRPMVLVGPPDAAAGESQNGAGDDAADGGKAAPHSDGHGAGGANDPTGDN